MIFRQALANDFEQVQKCIAAAFTPYRELLGVSPYALSVDFRALISQKEIFMLQAKATSTIIGVVRLAQKDQHIEIANMAINPDFQGRGFGKQILTFAKNFARKRGLCEVRLSTNADLPSLLVFYSKQGFIETHREQREDRTIVFFTMAI